MTEKKEKQLRTALLKFIKDELFINPGFKREQVEEEQFHLVDRILGIFIRFTEPPKLDTGEDIVLE